MNKTFIGTTILILLIFLVGCAPQQPTPEPQDIEPVDEGTSAVEDSVNDVESIEGELEGIDALLDSTALEDLEEDFSDDTTA